MQLQTELPLLQLDSNPQPSCSEATVLTTAHHAAMMHRDYLYRVQSTELYHMVQRQSPENQHQQNQLDCVGLLLVCYCVHLLRNKTVFSF